jgi:hypothetical protein
MPDTSERAGADKYSTLATPDQLEKEALALRLLASPEVQAALEDVRKLYAADPIAAMPGAQATLRAAADSIAMSAALGTVNKDVDRPVMLWSTTAAHKWHGLDVPRTGLVQDNPDNVHRGVPIDGAARYEIHGKVNVPGPAQETFVLYAARAGAGEGGVRENLEEAGMVSLDQIALGPDGTFVITIDSSPADGRTNHLQTHPDAGQGNVLIRDTLSDWAVQNPVQLSVRRVSGPPIRPAPTEAELAVAAADTLSKISRYWLAWEHRVFFSRPANAFTLNFARVTGWGFNRGGHFDLAGDEVLVVTLERRDAAYLSFQVTDLWGPSVNYVDRSGGLNQAVARADADGAYT